MTRKEDVMPRVGVEQRRDVSCIILEVTHVEVTLRPVAKNLCAFGPRLHHRSRRLHLLASPNSARDASRVPLNRWGDMLGRVG